MEINVGAFAQAIRTRALERAMLPREEDAELARSLRARYGHDVAGALEDVLKLDVYRARRVLVALLDMLSDEEFDSLHRQFGER